MNAKVCNAMVPGNIQRLLQERGLKQRFVADRAKFTRQQFSDMLTGRRIIKVCDVVAIAEALDVSVADLYEAGRPST